MGGSASTRAPFVSRRKTGGGVTKKSVTDIRFHRTLPAPIKNKKTAHVLECEYSRDIVVTNEKCACENVRGKARFANRAAERVRQKISLQNACGFIAGVKMERVTRARKLRGTLDEYSRQIRRLDENRGSLAKLRFAKP